MDWSITHGLNGFLAHHDGVEDPLKAYVGAAEVVFVLLLAAMFLFAGGLRRHVARRASVAAVASTGVALAIGQVISRLVDRPRPFVSHPGAVHMFSAHAADSGFPSDHATASFAIAVALLLRDRRWGSITLALAAVLAVGRVALGVHYPSDVLGGAALGAGCAIALYRPRPRAVLDALADRLGGFWDAQRASARRVVTR
jgi:undecaprenyl-diphosphatase